MPIEWGLLAAKAVVSAAVGLPLKKAVDGVEKLFHRGALSDELATAYRAAFEAFERTLTALCGGQLDEATQARLTKLFDDDERPDQIWRLPYRPEAESLADEPAAFSAMLAGVLTDDVSAAWRALVRTFHQQVASKEKLSRFVSHAQAGRQEDLLAEIRGLLERHLDRADPTNVAAWREALAKRLRFADTSGLFWREKERPNEGIELREIFVETTLRREVRERKPKEPEPPDREGRPGEAEPLERRRRPATEPQRAEPQSIAEVLRAERHLVILGPPGSGKSTLTRCLALSLAVDDAGTRPLESGLPLETVPVLLELKAFAARLGQEPTLKLDAWIAERVGKDLANLHELLETGRALVLLDGLDEVFDEAHRRWVSDEVWRLLTRYDRAHFVLTSRPHGYWAAPLPGPVPVFEMMPFDEERIGRFFRGWFGALYRIGVDAGIHEAPPDQRAAELTRDVLEHDRLRALAENPMLCTLIVLVHRSRSDRLPERRVDFYEAAVRTLLEFWEQRKRSPKQQVPLEFPEPRFLRQVLSEVAWRAMTELGGRELPTALLKRWLEGALAFDAEWTGKRGQRAVDDFLQVVSERTGLLTDAGGGRYQFLHLSLQEYLVARYLLDRLNERQRNAVFRHFLHAPGWEEILRHAVARAEPVVAEQLIEAVLGEPTSEFEDRLHRDLRFVCRCLGDRAVVGKEVLSKLHLRLAATLGNTAALDRPGLMLDGAKAGDSTALHQVLRQLLTDNNPVIRSTAAQCFALTGADDTETRSGLLQRLDDEDWGVQISAALCFARVAADEPETRDAFLQRLTDENPLVRMTAVQFFAAIGADDAETRNALLQRLADKDPFVKLVTARFFADNGANDPEVRNALFEHLAAGEDWGFMHIAVLAQIQANNPEPSRRVFLQRLLDKRPIVRMAAAEYFAEIGADDSETRNALLQRLTDRDPMVRCGAVKFFARIGSDEVETKNAVLQRLADEHRAVRRSAVEYFARVGADEPGVRNALLQRLADRTASVRCAAVEAFARIGVDNPEVRNALFQRLADKKASVRSAVVQCFVQVGRHDLETRNGFLQRLADEHWSIRSAAVRFFARVGADDPEIRNVLTPRLKDGALQVRREALRFFLAWRVADDSWEPLLDSFARIRTGLGPEEDWDFSALLGQLAAAQPALLRRLLHLEHDHFFLDEALRAFALARDEARRRSTPVQALLDDSTTGEFTSPGRAEPRPRRRAPATSESHHERDIHDRPRPVPGLDPR